MAKFSPTKSDSLFISSANKCAATQSSSSRNARFSASFLPKKWLDIKWIERNLPLKNFRKFGYTSRGYPSFLEVLKNTVPFATGSCRKFKVDVLVEWKAPKVCLRKLFFPHRVFSNGYELIFILLRQFCKIGINFDQYLKPLKSHM